MATTVNAFNEMMDQFLTELNLTFPENKAIIKFQAAFELLRQTAPSQILDNFMGSVKPYGPKIMSKDESFITLDSKNIDALGGIDLCGMWDESSDKTKGAIWQYLQTLFILGTTIKSFPKDTLNMIEQMAEKCAGQMKDMDPSAGGAFSLMDLMNTISQQK
jgi:hypothetical protein